jgi:hypothetical protein
MAWNWRRCQSSCGTNSSRGQPRRPRPPVTHHQKQNRWHPRCWVRAMANGMRPTGLSPDRVRRVLCLRSDNHAWRLGRSDFIQNAVAERVNQTRLVAVSAVRTPDLALDVQRGSIPGQPGAKGPKAMTNEGRDGRSPRGTAAAADTATRDRATIRQGLASLEGVISRVWCHRQTTVIAILAAPFPSVFVASLAGA